MATWQAQLRDGRFAIQRCTACAHAIFPPRRLCPRCGELRLAWFEPGGLGTVHAVTVVARGAEQGGPYNVVLVDLDEGPRLMSRVDGLEAEAVRIGLRVQAQVAGTPAGPVLVFRPLPPAPPGA
ncbi:MAG: OB-fold domain-containing protein [Rubrivivax sp.]|nr:OB-fold domain-containing protein [Rubrivivax sp.]